MTPPPDAFTLPAESDLPAGTPTGRQTAVDPLRFCVAATVALIAWLVTPALAVAVFGALGTAAYLRAWRAGRLATRCKLGDTRLVVAYLGLLTVGGAAATVLRLVRLVS